MLIKKVSLEGENIITDSTILKDIKEDIDISYKYEGQVIVLFVFDSSISIRSSDFNGEPLEEGDYLKRDVGTVIFTNNSSIEIEEFTNDIEIYEIDEGRNLIDKQSINVSSGRIPDVIFLRDESILPVCDDKKHTAVFFYDSIDGKDLEIGEVNTTGLLTAVGVKTVLIKDISTEFSVVLAGCDNIKLINSNIKALALSECGYAELESVSAAIGVMSGGNTMKFTDVKFEKED